MNNSCDPKLLQTISDYSLHASYCWWRLSIITNLSFNWCVHYGHVPPLDGKYRSDANEQRQVSQSKITQPYSVPKYDDAWDIHQ
jgi:hypothetical protein